MHFFCSSNNLCIIETIIFIVIIKIFLFGCRFPVIPSVVYELQKLEILFVNGNRIEEVDVERLQHMPLLSTLNLQNNNIVHVPPELALIPKLVWVHFNLFSQVSIIANIYDSLFILKSLRLNSVVNNKAWKHSNLYKTNLFTNSIAVLEIVSLKIILKNLLRPTITTFSCRLTCHMSSWSATQRHNNYNDVRQVLVEDARIVNSTNRKKLQLLEAIHIKLKKSPIKSLII